MIEFSQKYHMGIKSQIIKPWWSEQHVTWYKARAYPEMIWRLGDGLPLQSTLDIYRG